MVHLAYKLEGPVNSVPSTHIRSGIAVRTCNPSVDRMEAKESGTPLMGE